MIDKLMKPLNSLYNNIIIRRYKVQHGENLKINGRLHVYVYGKFILGNNVAINSGFKYNPIGGQERTIFYIRNKAEIIIGNSVGISNSTFFSINLIRIEDNVKIGGSCKFYDNDFHSLSYQKRSSSYDADIISKPILIKEGAFIGAHSIVLKGVTVGCHSIVGAGSVVTKDVPDREIWAGNPAHFISKVIE